MAKEAAPPDPATRLQSLPPIVGLRPRILVLGSMPGAESLRQQRYYAHPRNAFWRICGALLGFDAGLPYGERLAALRRHRIALWDVALSCERDASHDATIRSVVPNRIAELLRAQPSIRRILVNGRTAERLFVRLVLPGLGESPPELIAVPSTSPAHAAMPFARKLARWRAAMAPALRG